MTAQGIIASCATGPLMVGPPALTGVGAPPSSYKGILGQEWIDTSVSPRKCYVFTGAEWITDAQGTGDVDSVTGTANQILANPTTGDVVLSLIGPYTPATYTAHGVLIGEGTSSIVATAAGTAGQVLTSGGAGADPGWTTATFPSTVTAGDLLYASAANVISGLADVAVNQVLVSGGVGVAPAYSATPTVTTLTATTVHGTTIDTNVAAAELSLSGTTIAATGSDANVSLNITTKNTGSIIFSQSKAGVDQNMQITNSDNTAAAGNAGLQLAVGGSTSTGDPYVSFQISGVAASTMTMGLDNSASDIFVISNSATIGTSNALTLTQAGALTATTSITATTEVRAAGDSGGAASQTSLTNGNSTTIGAGVGSVKMSTANAADNTAWIKIYIGTNAYWIPAWTTNAP